MFYVRRCNEQHQPDERPLCSVKVKAGGLLEWKGAQSVSIVSPSKMCIRGITASTMLLIDPTQSVPDVEHDTAMHFGRVFRDAIQALPKEWSGCYGVPLRLPAEHCGGCTELWGASFGGTHGVEVVAVRDVDHQPIYEGVQYDIPIFPIALSDSLCCPL